ncbi:PR-1-like protein [Pleomassaria siparia CBS 279.74]|uniref:PR-1-like protein n=1 Tax=Pleomassaria siparia CBS 279.74 TaxID=1314801 RepID=A0A6G1KF64_9PLEO|nr:PR-1-like protein [Pleomassaria siparia CBS 279.74]
MRSAVLLVSAMAIGAIAGPFNRRYVVTRYEAVTVYLTAPTPAPSAPAPAPETEPTPIPAPAPVSAQSSDQHKSGTKQQNLRDGPEYKAAMIYHHNAARANHGANPLVWDEECRKNAQINAERCDFKHYIPEGAGQGQNLFVVSGDAFNATAGVTESWYKGEFKEMTDNNLWGKADIPSEIFHAVGHLTAMLWKATTKVGCHTMDCGSSMTVGGSPSDMNKYTVCNYASAGNYGGEYAKNVGLPISKTKLGSWSD